MADAKREKVKAQEKEAKAAKRAKRKETRKQVWQAFNMQRKQDKWLIPLMLLAFLGLGLVGFLLGLIFHAQWFGLIIGLMFGAMLAMYIFPKRMENSFYERTKDEPGAAAWVVENLKDGPGMQWRTKTAVAANAHMDVVHRVVGAPGIILVGEGAPHRLKPLMEQQKKRLNRIAKQYPVYGNHDATHRRPVHRLGYRRAHRAHHHQFHPRSRRPSNRPAPRVGCHLRCQRLLLRSHPWPSPPRDRRGVR